MADFSDVGSRDGRSLYRLRAEDGEYRPSLYEARIYGISCVAESSEFHC
jgi:hypothetical protein